MQKKGTNNTYWGNIGEGISSAWQGLRLSFRHFKNARKRHSATFVDDASYFQEDVGVVTLQYPTEQISVPEVGRYKLHNEMDDCIVCDKCAKICPVDCIDIEPIKATGIVGHASDGSPIRLYAAKFDIDMAKCCFCGLCTTVCPTECLTMTSEYDFATFEVKDLNFAFGNLSPAQADEKKALYEQYMAEKKAGGLTLAAVEKEEAKPEVVEVKKPAFKPTFKPKVSVPIETPEAVPEVIEVKKPAFKPTFKPKVSTSIEEPEAEKPEVIEVKKPAFKPTFKPKVSVPTEEEKPEVLEVKKPAFKPTFRPKPKDE